MSSRVKTHNLGYPRIGAKRELKKATEDYWKGNFSAEELQKTGVEIRKSNWLRQQKAGVDLIPSNDFSEYDQVLDMSCLLGAVPARFEWDGDSVTRDLRFRMARGIGRTAAGEKGIPAMEMTKWFDTNYHYIVPEFHAEMEFRISSSKIFDEFQEALYLGVQTLPVLIGPVTYLWLGKESDPENPVFTRFDLLKRLLPVYQEILEKLHALGAEWVQIDEPVFSLDLDNRIRSHLSETYTYFASSSVKPKIMIANYFGDLRDNLHTFINLPVDGLHVDAVRGAEELERIIIIFPQDKILSAGIVDGRNVWKNDSADSLSKLNSALQILGADRLMVSPSCSLLHSPVTLQHEGGLNDELKNWLAFAEEKLVEIGILAETLSGKDVSKELEANRRSMENRNTSSLIHNPNVKKRADNVRTEDLKRQSPYQTRRKIQRESMPLPDFPTTTIGSFPQTPEVRQARVKLRRGEWSESDYERFLKSEIERTVRFQEKLDIDVLVHGESERNDMVEFFGEQLEGFAFTRFGWVQSFGTRYVKPPIIFGDVWRPGPMTVHWSAYAQSLTSRPMKGMLTGPVTILQWSFVRNDQPRSLTCRQIALAIRDEVQDLEKAGIRVIQIDEPAIREGLPLRHADWDIYLKWAVENYLLATTGVADATQIHTHMCYSEFNDMIEAIAALDTDVISIESSRSNMELLDAFVDFKYPSEIGPGVYDIHSPRIPTVDEMASLLKKAEQVLPRENLWVNPDCGLKTRRWEEVKPALENMVAAAKQMRAH